MASVESNLMDRRNTLFSLFKQSKPIASRQTKLLPSINPSFKKGNGPERKETWSPSSTSPISPVAPYHVALYAPSVHAQNCVTKKEKKSKGTNGVKKTVKRGIKKIVAKVIESALEEAVEKCGKQNTKAIKKVVNTKKTQERTELGDKKENINLCSLQKLVSERTGIKELCDGKLHTCNFAFALGPLSILEHN